MLQLKRESDVLNSKIGQTTLRNIASDLLDIMNR